MSRFSGYICDICKGLKTEAQVKGVSPIADMFNNLSGYAFVAPLRADCHICTTCRVARTVHPVEAKFNKGRQPREYDQYFQELSFLLRKEALNRKGKK